MKIDNCPHCGSKLVVNGPFLTISKQKWYHQSWVGQAAAGLFIAVVFVFVVIGGLLLGGLK